MFYEFQNLFSKNVYTVRFIRINWIEIDSLVTNILFHCFLFYNEIIHITCITLYLCLYINSCLAKQPTESCHAQSNRYPFVLSLLRIVLLNHCTNCFNIHMPTTAKKMLLIFEFFLEALLFQLNNAPLSHVIRLATYLI